MLTCLIVLSLLLAPGSKYININPKTTDEELHAFLSQIGCDIALIPQLRQEAEQFRNDFLARADWQ